MLLLIVQFLLGTAVNLFVAIPPITLGRTLTTTLAASPRAWSGDYASSVDACVAHLPRPSTRANRDWDLLRRASGKAAAPLVAAALGAIGILAAGVNGGSFLVSGENYSSMLMAAGFAIAVTAYSVAMFLASPQNHSKSNSVLIGDEY